MGQRKQFAELSGLTGCARATHKSESNLLDNITHTISAQIKFHSFISFQRHSTWTGWIAARKLLSRFLSRAECS